MAILQTTAEILAEIRKKKPLIHQLTNYVSMNDCANITLAIGASPVMANDPGEVEDMVSHAACLVINIGTLDARRIDSMIAAGARANTLGIPVVLDPVGVGATTLRTAAATAILEQVQVTVIRGNMAEVKTLSGLKAKIRGVDSIDGETDAGTVAVKLANSLNCIVAITGKTDIVTDGSTILRIENGHVMLAGVTGTGCMATALIGCFCGASGNYLASAVGGIAAMGIAGEIAERSLASGEGLGTFRMRLFDAVSLMTPDSFTQAARIS